jgi:hypothetical protein
VPSPDIRVIVSLPEMPPPVRFTDLHPAGRLHGDGAVDEEEGPLDLHTVFVWFRAEEKHCAFHIGFFTGATEKRNN